MIDWIVDRNQNIQVVKIDEKKISSIWKDPTYIVKSSPYDEINFHLGNKVVLALSNAASLLSAGPDLTNEVNRGKWKLSIDIKKIYFIKKSNKWHLLQCIL